MTVQELKNLAYLYAAGQGDKTAIIRQVWNAERRDGLVKLAEYVGTDVKYLFWRGGIKNMQKNRSRARRGQKAVPPGVIDPADAARLAHRAARGGRIASGGYRRGAKGAKASVADSQAWEAARGESDEEA